MSVVLLLVGGASSTWAQVSKVGPYEFTVEKEIPHTEVRDQNRTGTCWAFAATGLVESEVIRNGHGSIDLSEMWIVRNAYFEKVVKYVRMGGTINFGQGGNAHDEFDIIAKYGIVTEEAYPGNEYGEKDGHVHGEVAAVLQAFAQTIVKNPNRTLSTAWHTALNGILDSYFGKMPEKFSYKGKEYTAKSFVNYLGINPADYITLTSYSHHPYYTQFAIEIPDNWAWGKSYNLPLNEFTQATIDALKAGYAVCWDSDVSEKGFKHALGFALLPETDVKNMDNSERARWENVPAADMTKNIYNFKAIVPEQKVTQEARQLTFDNFQTTDDHLMLFVGLYKDQNGKDFFKVKNSWNTDNSVAEGFLYSSVPFFEMKTISVTLNKNSLPAVLKTKLGIK